MKHFLKSVNTKQVSQAGERQVARDWTRLFWLVLFVGMLLVVNPFQKEEVAHAAPMAPAKPTFGTVVEAKRPSASSSQAEIQPASAGFTRTWGLRYDVLSKGANLAQLGNSLTTCKAGTNNLRNGGGAPTCTNIQAGNEGGNSWYNDDYNIVYNDVDGDSSTFDSSTATESLTVTQFTVLRAQLYWGGSFNPYSSTLPPGADQMKFKGPTGAYHTVSADVYDSVPITVGNRVGLAYGATADVTSLFTAAGWLNGTYTGANVQATTGCTSGQSCDGTQSAGNGSLGNYAGWSLLIVYQDLTDQTVRYVGVDDGFTCVVNGATGCPLNITVSFTGFNIPVNATTGQRWGLLAWDGDNGGGDGFKMNNVQQSDNEHPVSNYFNSRISLNGTEVTTRNPSYDNNLGIDIVEQNNLNVTAGTTSIPGQFTTGASSELVLQHYFWIVAATTNTDYGDAPTSYGIASHDISLSASTLHMGTATTDPETGMQNTGGFATCACGDDNTGTDDEDGATYGFIPGQTTYKVKITAKNTYTSNVTANLYGWIDFNQNGKFDDNESVTATIPANTSSTSVTLTWTGKPSFSAGATLYARFRLTTDNLTDSDPTQDGRAVGSATNGEVEDYLITVQGSPTANSLNKFVAKNKGNDVQLGWQTANELNLAGFNVWRQTGNGAWKQMNKNPIQPKNPGGVTGAKYKFTDKSVKAGKTYQYKLEILAAKGSPEWSDVVNVNTR